MIPKKPDEEALRKTRGFSKNRLLWAALLEFTAWIEGDRHIPLREISMVGGLLAAEKDSQGRPVDDVRVVFLDEATARWECRPLKDVDALVYFHNLTGNLVEVVD